MIVPISGFFDNYNVRETKIRPLIKWLLYIQKPSTENGQQYLALLLPNLLKLNLYFDHKCQYFRPAVLQKQSMYNVYCIYDEKYRKIEQNHHTANQNTTT